MESRRTPSGNSSSFANGYVSGGAASEQAVGDDSLSARSRPSLSGEMYGEDADVSSSSGKIRVTRSGSDNDRPSKVSPTSVFSLQSPVGQYRDILGNLVFFMDWPVRMSYSVRVNNALLLSHHNGDAIFRRSDRIRLPPGFLRIFTSIRGKMHYFDAPLELPLLVLVHELASICWKIAQQVVKGAPKQKGPFRLWKNKVGTECYDKTMPS